MGNSEYCLENVSWIIKRKVAYFAVYFYSGQQDNRTTKQEMKQNRRGVAFFVKLLQKSLSKDGSSTKSKRKSSFDHKGFVLLKNFKGLKYISFLSSWPTQVINLSVSKDGGVLVKT